MNPTSKAYTDMANKAVPPTNKLKNMLCAFFIGGLICGIGQGIGEIYKAVGVEPANVLIAIPVTMIFLGAFLTGINVYHEIARYGGAGTLVPITGFANAIVSPAMEFKKEGHVLGIGAKMFSIAGPVLVFGITASIIYGIILNLLT